MTISFTRWFCSTVSAVALLFMVVSLSGCDSMGPDLGQDTAEAAHHIEFDGDATDGQVDLVAGQHTKAGVVQVAIVGDDLHVTYLTIGGWCISEHHLAVGTSFEDLPTNRPGNPIPGHFEFSGTHSPCVTSIPIVIALADVGFEPGETLYIAAHAVVQGNGNGNGAGFLFGIRQSDGSATGGDIYRVFPNSPFVADHFFDTTINPPATSNWPNALAFDPDAGAEGRLYFSNTESIPAGPHPLYFVNLATNTQVSAGELAWRSASATMVDGDFYYVGQNDTDRLRKVTFHPNGTLASETIVCENFVEPGATPMFFGDLAYDSDSGLIIGSARIGANVDPSTLFSIDPDTCDYNEIGETPVLLQLAFDCDGRMIGHHTSTGNYFEVDLDTAALTPFGPSAPNVRMNDLAEGLCPAPPVGVETAWGWGERFVPQGNWARYFTFTP